METLNADSIVASITAALSNYPGRPHSDFYVGITNNLDQRLGEHRVTREDCPRIFHATNYDEAHFAESTLINIHHMTGKVGGGAPDSVWGCIAMKLPIQLLKVRMMHNNRILLPYA